LRLKKAEAAEKNPCFGKNRKHLASSHAPLLLKKSEGVGGLTCSPLLLKKPEAVENFALNLLLWGRPEAVEKFTFNPLLLRKPEAAFVYFLIFISKRPRSRGQ
jgi:hypothetical protein